MYKEKCTKTGRFSWTDKNTQMKLDKVVAKNTEGGERNFQLAVLYMWQWLPVFFNVRTIKKGSWDKIYIKKKKTQEKQKTK